MIRLLLSMNSWTGRYRSGLPPHLRALDWAWCQEFTASPLSALAPLAAEAPGGSAVGCERVLVGWRARTRGRHPGRRAHPGSWAAGCGLRRLRPAAVRGAPRWPGWPWPLAA